MRLENSFEVPAPPEQAWELLLDVPRVVPCIPGAQLTETVDDSHWKATVQVKLGPVSLTFLSDVAREEVDEAARRVVLTSRAREQRGRGGATATIESSLDPTETGTHVVVVTELQLSGAAAQFGGPMVKDVATELTRQFAECLKGKLTGPEPAEAAAGDGDGGAAAAAPAPAARPVSGLSLLFRALLARLRGR